MTIRPSSEESFIKTGIASNIVWGAVFDAGGMSMGAWMDPVEMWDAS